MLKKLQKINTCPSSSSSWFIDSDINLRANKSDRISLFDSGRTFYCNCDNGPSVSIINQVHESNPFNRSKCNYIISG